MAMRSRRARIVPGVRPDLPLPDDMITELCRHMDFETLRQFIRSNKYNYGLCRPVLRQRIKQYIRRINDAGYKFNKPGWFGAIQKNDIPIVRLFLAVGFPVDIKDREGGWTGMAQAVYRGHLDLIRVLAEAGADVNGFNESQPILGIAAYNGNGEAKIDTLLEVGADPNVKVVGVPLLNRLLRGSSLSAASGTPIPPEHVSIAKKLINARGINVDSRDHFDYTPLFWAIRNYFYDVVNMLIQHGADVNAVGSGKITPLHQATELEHQRGRCWMVKRLLDAGAKIGVLDREQRQIVGKCFSTACALM